MCPLATKNVSVGASRRFTLVLTSPLPEGHLMTRLLVTLKSLFFFSLQQK